MRRTVEIVVALGLLYLAWTYAMELFLAWYSGVDPELSARDVAWCVGSCALLLLAAGLQLFRPKRK